MKNCYLQTPLKDPEHMKTQANLVPEELIQEHNLKNEIVNGCIHMKIIRGMCGLPHAGRLANNLLK